MSVVTRVHGGPDARGVPLHDFSSNGNGCGPCPAASAAVREADAAHYPDPAYAALRERLAAFHKVSPVRILLAASGSEFIMRITAWAARQGARGVWLPPHGYGDYAHAARTWGLRPVQQPADAQLAWACEPSSPFGGGDEALPRLAGRAPSSAVVVLDRAYEPLRLQGSLALDRGQLDRLWQLWTPNKALGLTGVRAAYAIAPAGAPDAVAQVEALGSSWPVGAHGVALLDAWCEPAVQRWLAASRETLRDWKARQVGLCESLGWAVTPGHGNFFVCRTYPAVTHLLEDLGSRGIKLRDCASFGLPGHVRLGVRPPASQDALVQALRETRGAEAGR